MRAFDIALNGMLAVYGESVKYPVALRHVTYQLAGYLPPANRHIIKVL